MNRNGISRILAGILILAHNAQAFACSVCFKDPKSSLTLGVKEGVLVLLAFLLIVFFGFLKFLWDFNRRVRMHAEKPAV